MVDTLSYFSDWYNKNCGMCSPVCGMVHIKESLQLIEKISPCSCGSEFPLLLLTIRSDQVTDSTLPYG